MSYRNVDGLAAERVGLRGLALDREAQIPVVL